MIYRTYGQTGKKISAIGFGGMRFPEPKEIEKSAELVLYAHEKGITYFDTAPFYCEDQSQQIFGRAFSRLPRDSFVVSTKCGEADAAKVRRSLEESLDKLGVDKIDFFNVWGLRSGGDWETRKQGGAIDEMLKARDEGLIEHLVFSTHMTHAEAEEVFSKEVFEGVTLGYNAINFPFREQVVNSAGRHGLGVVTMNPLAGGLIPKHAERFDFIRSEDDPDVVSAALRFILSHPAVTCALVGFASPKEIDQAVAAVEAFRPLSAEHRETMKAQIEKSFEGLCTGCGYCLPCPQGLPIPRLMDAYNMRILQGSEPQHIADRLKWHWGLTPEAAEPCTACGACEKACTQHLPIIQRLKEIVEAGREIAAQEK
ncbi:MAG: aldo/keto reductase [Verrucomicrobia bacterium]|nr:aldo/keto reductase [Verrucomicrobiota bacterium]